MKTYNIKTQLLIIFIFFISLIFIYYQFKNNSITNEDINKNISENNTDIENFDDNANHLQNYNLIANKNINIGKNNNSKTIILPDNYYIKEIVVKAFNNKKISYDLEIFINNNGKKTEINMSQYKLDDTIFFYDDNILVFDKLEAINGDPILCRRMEFYCPTGLNIENILVFGNKTNSEISYGVSIFDDIILNGSGKDYYINSIELEPVNNNILDNDILINIKHKSSLDNDYSTIKYYAIINREYNLVFFQPPLLANHLDIFNQNNINIIDDFNMKIYGSIADDADKQKYMFEYGKLSFRDSLNPNKIITFDQLKDKTNKSMEIMELLDYQKKINTELREEDYNRELLYKLKTQESEINKLISKINKVSDEHVKLLQDTDDYNSNKLFTTMKILEFLKSELDTKKISMTQNKINLEEIV